MTSTASTTPVATPAAAAAVTPAAAPAAKAPAAAKSTAATKAAAAAKVAKAPKKSAAATKAPAAKPAATAKPAAKAKAAAPASSKPAAKAATPAVAPAKEAKAKKPKLVRDSFTIPKDEYAVVETLKQRAATLAQPAKKSELLRAGLKLLAGLSDTALRSALQAVPSIKTGRPKAEAPAAKPAAKNGRK